MSTITTTRYHHGDLAEALIRAGHTACRTAGPSGLVIRDLAAYRHFASIDHLRAAVSQRAREDLSRHMLQACEQASGGRTAAERARQRFHAIGEGYVRFAIAEPQLFATAFTVCSAFPTQPDEPSAWQVLVDAIDMLITTGVMPESRRDDAPWIAWSTLPDAQTKQAGVVTFHHIDDNQTRAMLQMQVKPNDAMEKIGDALGLMESGIKRDLKSFKEFIEERGDATGGWRGEVQ